MPRRPPPKRNATTYTAADSALLIAHAAALEKKGNPRLAALIRRKLDRCRGKPERTERAEHNLREAEALTHGLHVATRREIERPRFVVITPSGTRIETLEPDLA